MYKLHFDNFLINEHDDDGVEPKNYKRTNSTVPQANKNYTVQKLSRQNDCKPTKLCN